MIEALETAPFVALYCVVLQRFAIGIQRKIRGEDERRPVDAQDSVA